MMTASLDRFIEEITNKGWSALYGVPFPELPLYYHRAASFLRGRGVVSGNDLRLELQKQFRAICPACSRWITSSDVFTLHMAEEEGLVTTSYGPVSRMRDGACPNAECTESHAVVIWAGHPLAMKNIDSSMQYLLRDADPDDALRLYYRDDVVAFLADTIALNVSAKRSCSTGLALSSDAGEDKVAVNVSIVAGTPDPEWTRINIFPDGYMSFFNALLSHPQCDHNEVALMHWTYVFDEQNRMIRLMFFDRNRDIRLPGFLRCPWDLMTAEERRRFEGPS